MSQRLTKLIGISYPEFTSIASEHKEIHLRPARLIPMHKPGDEMALTSIFLSSLRLINEFRREISSVVGMTSSGSIHLFTEVTFEKYPDKRVDGLMLVVRGNKIIDAALLEMKNKNNNLDDSQMQDYIAIAKYFGIPRIITVSNQFVSKPTQSPLNVKLPKDVSLYHLSWSYILTIARLLLFDNDMNINDPDQVEIMEDVVNYLEHKQSGVCGFTSMKPGWKEVVQKTNTGAPLRFDAKDVDEAVCSWLQEEKDMALILSRKLGQFVESGEKKFKTDLQGRIDNEKKTLIDQKYIMSKLSVDGAVSSIWVQANLDRRNIVMSVTLNPPQNRKTRAQISWLRNQLKRCQSKNPNLFESLGKEISIGIGVKYSSTSDMVSIEALEDVWLSLKDSVIRSFTILQVKDVGRKTFSSRTSFITTIESMLLDYYEGIVQHLKRWEKPAPKISKKTLLTDEDNLEES